MTDLLLANEPLIRLRFFLGILLAMALWEVAAPRRRREIPRLLRWSNNLGIVIVDTLLVRLTFPIVAVALAVIAEERGWGLFNAVALPTWLEVLATVLIFDLAIWTQHLVTHKVPVLWRFHRVHHADRDFDVSTAIRFHPVEIAFSMLLKIGLVYLIGPPALGILMFEIILNGTALFNHANIRLPPWLDAVLRQFLVTPDMHRVHHSDLRAEHDSNYGFALSVWDRMFGTYIAQPEGGHDGMTIGLQWQDDRPSRLGWSLSLPFRRK